MAYHLVTRDQVIAHVSLPVAVDTLDDDNNGQIDNATLDLVISNSEALFYGAVRPAYEAPFLAPIDPLAVMVVLHIIHCQLAKRFPERFKKAGAMICETATELFRQVREGELHFAHPGRGGSLDGPECTSYTKRVLETCETYRDSFYVNDD